MRGKDLREDVHEERGADQTQKDPHGTEALRLFRVWEEVRKARPPEEAHEDPLCPGETLPGGGDHRLLAVSSAAVPSRVLEEKRVGVVNISILYK